MNNYRVEVKEMNTYHIDVQALNESHASERAEEYLRETSEVGDELMAVDSDIKVRTLEVLSTKKNEFGLDTLEERIRKAVQGVVADEVKVITIRI